MKTISHADWLDEEVESRGKMDCKFTCPVCGNEASLNDWKALGANPERAMQECIGRALPRDQRRRAFPSEEEPGAPERPCDYAAFGLIGLCETGVEIAGRMTPVFEFSPIEPA